MYLPLKRRKLFLFMLALICIFYFTGCSYFKVEANKLASQKSSDSEQSQASAKSTPTPEPTPTPAPTPEPVKLIEYNGPIRHIFFHCLIAFPEISYSKAIGAPLDTDCVTVLEFKRCLEELYKNNYVLVNIHSTYEVTDNNGVQTTLDKKLMLPEGKKPLIMSIDDIVYDPKKMGTGMVDKITLDKAGNFATYTKQKDGTEVISYDNEVIPILEQFVKIHPDFSFDGAKATLCVTGWVGILGYRIDRLEPNRQSEIDAVKPIVSKLKEKGWNFASHSYGHRHSNAISYNLFADDTEKWHNEIEPIVGPTDIYVYPYGETLSTKDNKYKLLLQYGFKMMCGVGSDNYWHNYGDSILMDRQAVDGYSLRNYKQYLAPLFDTSTVFDGENRIIH